MKSVIMLLIAIVSSSFELRAETPGLVTKESVHSVSKTLEKAMAEFKSKDITVFEVVKHHEGARKVDKKLPETVTVIFGKPELGAALMNDQRSVAIDLPQKLLIYKQGDKTFVSYNSTDYLRQRHDLSNLPELSKMSKALDTIATEISKF